MRKIKQDFEDTLRPEYKRSDFGDLVRGKFATANVEFAEIVKMFLACTGEDEGLKFLHHSTGNSLGGRHAGEWTYQIDNGNQVTLRYWVDQFGCLEESFASPCCISTSDERTQLQSLLEKHVRSLRRRVEEL